ncbi:MAG: hypothetical protein A2219_04770 [Elusimicrobia bacterium RIFOXYA2_FULL_50_26]|nr:MAG: hypothetical protein A2219_04770 [Elusimicrobia bacterium RIFOXYA2_FULL_50_26]OGS24924.1 MAG: hypothetical protein A2314_08995 [Elusimicrobia bacterium RIFOXYB2_FULL_50_12]
MISSDKIKEIADKIVNVIHPEKIILFGSYAYGKPTENSDLDILVIVRDSSEPRHRRARTIRKNLWELPVIPKDIIVYTEGEIEEWINVKEAFITQVVKKGKVLYENKNRTH